MKSYYHNSYLVQLQSVSPYKEGFYIMETLLHYT